MIVATHFDPVSWEESGQEWLEKAQGFEGLIIGNALDDDALVKISEYGVKYVPFKGEAEWDRFESILPYLEGRKCLLTRPNCFPVVQEGADVCCGLSDLSIFDVTYSVVNLRERARSVELLRNRIEKVHGGFLAAKWILGTTDFWNSFVGFQRYLRKRRYIDWRPSYDEAALNIFMALVKSFSLEISHG